MGEKYKSASRPGGEADRERPKPIADAAALRLRTIAASLNMPVEAFSLSHSSAAVPQVFASREEEGVEILRLYFAVDDVAARLRFLELLRGFSTATACLAEHNL
ncbi:MULTISPECIES: hypothetical protein [unclassified Methylobacterium]|uniref:hypothetical protein n=1 Tax=unclassified Methylobacterium TaxID=2615210 RepID=UPI0011C20C57|nr:MULTISPECIES: hypothetical protein [unclassified Methylobacterium]QEE41333.1 hypothetical protein FVA80_22585 [Methylobacterium sp. WL1]TXN57763.1 hypothetical protein FV241_09900 [Methylobacterium sp. WL2]